ncbi:MAG: selenide, water dikinase SelD [Rhodospirillales bacterium]|nr:selenide, water dikinase SelD [Rhodospirillales bacterium]
MSADSVRLTSLAHGGGCGCKIAPALLAELLAELPEGLRPPELLVGTENGDDAAVWQLNDRQALVATTDFFMPIVDDPFDFGRIAATNALSDVYAMGARPIFALALVGMPIDKLAPAVIRQILAGGQEACRQAGILVAGGHSIDSVEPIYGLVALGLVDPTKILRNDRARAGDVLILGKPIGIGILSAALKKEALAPEAYRRMVELTTRLNTAGPDLATLAGVHAATDVTGFGLLGHLWEVCRGSRLRARLDYDRVPILPEAQALVGQGFATGASKRNWASYGANVAIPESWAETRRTLLCDPQTSGGLLVACAPEAAADVLALFVRHGSPEAAIIGSLGPGQPGIDAA